MFHENEAAIGIIGGSGLYQIPGVEGIEEVVVETPFGAPSDSFRVGRWHGKKIVFLARHGRGHTVDPTHIPYRANIYGMKSLGVRQILSVSAVGSMKEELLPGHLVAVDQFIDRTRHRDDSFYGEGCVAHVAFSDPICPTVRGAFVNSARSLDFWVQDGGTYVCMEGPAFSTRSESLMYRQFGVSVIGMTNLTEAKLAREAEICYSTLALVTDYDCWHEGEENVTVEAVVATLKKNVANAQRVLSGAVSELNPEADCSCQHALEGAIMTAPNALSSEALDRLGLLIDRHVQR
jgi:5'-methylthioadenosine phosphorylase